MTPPNITYLLLLSLLGADALRVDMRNPLVPALRGDNVTIPCDISDLEPDKIITVHWTRGGESDKVYDYIPGRVKVYRAGSYMVESEIQRGNAALHIPQVQLSDEGEYTCTVFVTPDRAEGKSTLQVSVQPSAVLTPGDITIELGTEKSVLCQVINYYPNPASIRWVRYSKNSPGCVVLDKGTCISDPVSMDNMFNVSSHLTLHPTKEDDGHKYSCIVSHRSLEKELMMNFTLTVTERESNTGAVVGAVVGTLLATLILVGAFLLYFRMYKKDPPILSDNITGTEEMVDMTRTMLTCPITGFRPNDIEISVCLRRKEQEQRTILTWRSRDVPSARVRVGPSSGGDHDEELGLINNGSVDQKRPLHIELVPDIKQGRLGIFSCECRMNITPSFEEDDGAELSIHVKHPAISSPVSVQRTLKVIGVAPKLTTVMGPERMIHGEMVTLTCPINGFRPKALTITWLKLDQNNQVTELVTCGTVIHDNKYLHDVKEIQHDDGSYSVLSALRMTVNVDEDNGTRYICRTHHPASGKAAEEGLAMVVVARPVLDPILREEKSVCVGKPLDLSCRIHSFYPAQIKVTWYRGDGTELPSHTSNVLYEVRSMCYVTSTGTFTPAATDAGKEIRCEVQHVSLPKPTSVTWTVRDLKSSESIGEIQCIPEYPVLGMPVTLSCTISNLFPKYSEARWNLNGCRLQSGNITDSVTEDPETRVFNGTIALTLTPQLSHHDGDFRLDIIKSTNTVKKTYTMKLAGIPILSNITSAPDTPSYGKPLTLRCDVTNCRREDISVYWLQGDNKSPEKDTQVTEENGVISCTLGIIPTAEDYGKTVICCVKHKVIQEVIKKMICVTLPDKSPSLSEITARPERPGVGEETSLTVTIFGFSPRDLRVQWYKGFNEFPSNNVTLSPLRIGADSLYTGTSTLRFTPQPGDAFIRCAVTHTVTKAIREKRYTIRLAGETDPDPKLSRKTVPTPRYKILGIECVPGSPRVGEEVTLRCNVEGCSAEGTMFSWYKGIFPLEGKKQDGNLEDGSGSFSTITFTPEESDRESPIRCEVCSNYLTTEETFTLRLQ